MENKSSGIPWWVPLVLLLIPMIVCPLLHAQAVQAALTGQPAAPTGGELPAPTTTPAAVASTEPTATPGTDASTAAGLSVLKDGEKVTLRGVVPDEATKAALVARAKELYGDGNVTDELTIEAGAKGDWLASAAKLPPTFDNSWNGGGVELQDGKLILTGTLPSEAARKKILAYYEPLAKAANLTIDDRMVVESAAPTVAAKPTPEPKQPKAGAQADLSALALKNIEFETSSANITARGRRILNEAAAVLKSVPGTPVEIGGHTDDRGDDAANQRLSQRRAEATRRYLIGKGVEAGRLTAMGFGESQPIADNTNEAGRQKNRRIAFKLK
jgi:outer membrane protein OmpA-like peptidoglycan-associated protein